jgi:hypothetical protein
MLEAIKGVNSALSFFLELAVLVAVCYWGFKLKANMAVKVVAGIGALVVFAVVWFLFGAPDATYEAHGAGRVVLEVLWFGGGAAALAASGRRNLSVIFVVLYVINAVLRIIWNQV